MNTLNLVEKENQFRKEFEIFSYKNLSSVSILSSDGTS